MLNWGSGLLRLIFKREQKRTFSRESFLDAYPFFTTKIFPRANAYLINRLVSKDNLHILKDESFRSAFERFTDGIGSPLLRELHKSQEGPYVHQLRLDGEFLDFIRLKTRTSRMSKENALMLKEMVDEELGGFLRSSQKY